MAASLPRIMVKQQVVAISASPKGETKGIAAFIRGFVNQRLPNRNRNGKEKAGAICRNISWTSGINFFLKGRLRSISLAKAKSLAAGVFRGGVEL